MPELGSRTQGEAGPGEARPPLRAREVRVVVASLLASSLFCVGLEWARVEYTGERTYLFLIWNLFLAWIPLAAALATEAVWHRGGWRAPVVALGALWLLFFPNAPYIVTDFVHLSPAAAAPLWFDVLLIATFAWTGLLLGFVSLSRIQGLVASALGRLAGWLVAAGALVLASFGIYIGRFEVLNSWDVIVQPVPLARDTWQHLTSPATYPRTLGVTVSYAVFLLLSYAAFCAFGRLVQVPDGRSDADTPAGA